MVHIRTGVFAGKKGRADLYAFGSECKGSNHSTGVGDASCGNDGCGDRIRDLRQSGVPVTRETVKLCKTGTAKEFAEGCNTIPPGTVPPDYAIDFWSPNTPELGFNSALLGEPDY